MELLFNIANSILTRVDTAKIVGRNITKAKFSFDDDTWNDIAKVAVFSRGTTGYPVMLSEDGTCEIPDDILTHSGYCRVEIDGSNGYATNFVTLYVYPNLQSNTQMEDVAEKNLLQQVVDLINELKHTVIDPTLITQCVGAYIEAHPDQVTDPAKVQAIVEDYVTRHHNDFKGDTGAAGKPGVAGLSAYEIAKVHGYYGTEELWLQSLKGECGESGADGKDGRDGIDGKSAYEIWLEAGNQGTERDFLASLKGEKGDRGNDGDVSEIDMSAYAKKQDIPNTTLESDLTTSVAVGGIAEGKTYQAGTSVQTILDELLNPTLYPTFINPSATLSAPGSHLLESGSSSQVTMTIAFDNGSISPAYGTSGKRAGNATAYVLGSQTQTSNSFTVTVNENAKTFQGNVVYAKGEQPKDSKGNDYSSPLVAGNIKTNTVNYEFVNALYANVSKIDIVSKLELVSKSAKTKQFNFPAQTIANPEEFHVPANWNVTAIQVLNTMSGKWEDCKSEFTKGTTIHNDAAGNKVNYVTYKDNRGYNAGARSIKITWN